MPSPPLHLLPDLITYFRVPFVLLAFLSSPLVENDKYLLISYVFFFRSGVDVVNVQATNAEDRKIYIKIVGFLLKLPALWGFIWLRIIKTQMVD